jgi:hypothetical protein
LKALSFGHFGQDQCMTITKIFPGTNTLPHLATASVTKKKGFKALSFGQDHCMTITKT